MICLLFNYLLQAANCYFRLGNTMEAEKLLTPLCSSHSKSIDPDIVALACSNLSFLRMNQSRFNEGIEKAFEAVEISSRLYPRDSPEVKCIVSSSDNQLRCVCFFVCFWTNWDSI